MEKGLMDSYELVVEKALGPKDKGVVNAPKLPKPGQGFEGDKMKAPGLGIESPAAKNADKPVAASEKLNPGHGKISEQKDTKKETKQMLPQSKFDDLFNSTLVKEADMPAVSDENPVEAPDKFDDETGDFPEDGAPAGAGSEEEAVDVATKLRMIIDDLTEIAEKLGAYEKEEAAEGEAVPEVPAKEPAMGEAVSSKGPGNAPADGKLKGAKDATSKMQSKGNMVVNSEFKPSPGHTGEIGGPGHDGADGKLKPFKGDFKKLQGKNNQVDSNVKAGRKVIG